MSEEKIVCAAIHYNHDKHFPHQPVNIHKGLVIAGYRHGNCYLYLKQMFPRLEYKNHTVQGFITNKNRFVCRREGARIHGIDGNVLFSEDLY